MGDAVELQTLRWLEQAGYRITDRQRSFELLNGLLRGHCDGVIEGVTEKMGIDNLFDLIKTGGKTAVKNVLKQAGVEGTEEGFSYVFNLLAISVDMLLYARNVRLDKKRDAEGANA
jgi:hypothetical protein